MSGTTGRESKTSNLEGSDLEETQLNSPSPTPRVSLPIIYSDPNDPSTERPVDDIQPDEIFVRTGLSVTETTDLIQNADQFVGETQNILDQNILENEMSEEVQQNLIDVQSLAQNLPDGADRPNTINLEINSGNCQDTLTEDSLGTEAISLEAALKLLPNSLSGDNQEEMEIFLEECDFALSCTNKRVQPRLLQGNMVRLNGKARQAIKFRTFDS